MGVDYSSQDKNEASTQAYFKNKVKDTEFQGMNLPWVRSCPESFFSSTPTAPITWPFPSSLAQQSHSGSDGVWSPGSLRPEQGPQEGPFHPSQTLALASS